MSDFRLSHWLLDVASFLCDVMAAVNWVNFFYSDGFTSDKWVAEVGHIVVKSTVEYDHLMYSETAVMSFIDIMWFSVIRILVGF